ncbi:MAG: squalene/phytoene synthase family protein [Gammaproteobacteria bacterium]
MASEATADAPLADYLPRPGSDLYYAQRYAAAPARARLALLEALRGEIARVPANCSNAEIAQAKLAWWREEIARLVDGSPRHVLTRALAPQLTTLPALPAAALALIDGTAALLAAPRHATRAARYAAFDAAHGPLWEIVNAETARLDDAATRRARLLGSRVEEAYALRDARRIVASGTALLAQDTVSAVAQQGAATLEDADWYARVIAIDLAACRDALAAGLTALPARRQLRPLATLTRLALATLDEVAADGCRVWERRVELTPLRKLWIALRERAGW